MLSWEHAVRVNEEEEHQRRGRIYGGQEAEGHPRLDLPPSLPTHCGTEYDNVHARCLGGHSGPELALDLIRACLAATFSDKARQNR